MKNRKEPVYQIGIAARLVDCHPQTLRMYERLGLIEPDRSDSGVRLYSDEDIERLRQIKRLTQEMGVNLAGVEVVLHLLELIDRMQEEIERLREALRLGPRALGPARERGAKKVEVVFRESHSAQEASKQ